MYLCVTRVRPGVNPYHLRCCGRFYQHAAREQKVHDCALEALWPLVFGQLAPADWLLGVSKVSTRNFLIGTGIGIIPGVVLFVVAGGGLFDYFRDMPTDTRRLVIGVLVALAVSRRVWLRRRRRARAAAAAAATTL